MNSNNLPRSSRRLSKLYKFGFGLCAGRDIGLYIRSIFDGLKISSLYDAP